MVGSILPESFDPYDLWMTPLGVYAKEHFYKGHIRGKLLSVAIGLADWLAPQFSRLFCGEKKRPYPITVAQWILSSNVIDSPEYLLKQLLLTSSKKRQEYGNAWGLGFPWMSKNGLYDEDMPFITHTPYALEALLKIYQESNDEAVSSKAFEYFSGSLSFLSGLKVKYEDSNSLALSYAPIDEPRMVVNANSYAAYCYALHWLHSQENTQINLQRCEKLVNWVIKQQQENGSWYYYADSEPGNFIDCFHTCFVLKNLIKISKIAAHLEEEIKPVVDRGMAYLDGAFLDRETGLMKRFTVRDIKDPFVWDLYDQAEYLGLLVMRGETDRAAQFLKIVSECFNKNGHWYCRKDFFGRLWGKNFLRWGIMPLLHQQHELNALNRVA